MPPTWLNPIQTGGGVTLTHRHLSWIISRQRYTIGFPTILTFPKKLFWKFWEKIFLTQTQARPRLACPDLLAGPTWKTDFLKKRPNTLVLYTVGKQIQNAIVWRKNRAKILIWWDSVAVLVFYDVIMTLTMRSSRSDVTIKNILKTYSYRPTKHFYQSRRPLHNLNMNYRGWVNVTPPVLWSSKSPVWIGLRLYKILKFSKLGIDSIFNWLLRRNSRRWSVETCRN